MEIHVTATTPASPDEVWAILTDLGGWASWSDFTNSALIEEGEGGQAGVGATWDLWQAGLVRVRERVTMVDPAAKTLEYASVAGNPVRGYAARVELSKDGAGTQIHWRATGRPPLPLPGADLLSGVVLRLVLSRLADALGRRAARGTTAG